MLESFSELNNKVVSCIRCPRLVHHRETVSLPKRFQNEPAWRKPVPGFGDARAWLFILGLAPAPIGGNRTGRIFTGDESAKFLMRGLYEAGFANQPISESRNDGLILQGCYLTAAVKCVPPGHKPFPIEFLNCSEYFHTEISLLKNLKAVLALGQFAFDAYLNFLKRENILFQPRPPFAHGKKVVIPGRPTLYGSFHPSPQNTYTKKLTMEMFLQLLDQIKKENSSL